MAKMTSVISLDGIEIHIEKKSIRNMYIRISPPDGLVKITAPRNMPQYKIEAFARQRMAWIRTHKEKYSVQKERSFNDGETLFLWGKAYTIVLIETKGKAFAMADQGDMTARLFIHQDFGTKEKLALWEDHCRESLSKAIPDALARCEEKVGTRANEWHIKKMKTRWGSCNYIKKRIWINLALAYKPPVCLDYVLTHELVHLYEIKHNARFKSFMDDFFPAWREVKRVLNEKQD